MNRYLTVRGLIRCNGPDDWSCHVLSENGRELSDAVGFPDRASAERWLSVCFGLRLAGETWVGSGYEVMR